MTLEEAKKEIERHEAVYRECSENAYCSGLAGGLREALIVLDEVEPVVNPDKLTLKELVQKLRQMFDFEYLTCEILGGCRVYVISLWNGKPRWRGGSWWWCDGCDLIVDIKLYMKFIDLDLFEYNDADGIIDYSKCIVEVADDID